MQSLFREKAIKSNADRLIGEVSIASQPRYNLYTTFILATTFTIILISLLTDYSKVKTVQGIIEPVEGEIKIYAPIDGRISELDVNENSIIKKGRNLAKIISKSHAINENDINQYIDTTLIDQKRLIKQNIINQKLLFKQQKNEVLTQIRTIKNNLTQQKKIIKIKKELLAIAKAKVKNSRELKKRNYISQQSYDLVQEKNSLKQLDLIQAIERKTAINQKLIRLKSKLESLSLVNNTKINQFNGSLAQININVASLQKESSSSVIAPIDGIATALNVKVNQEIKKGEVLFTIYPERPRYEATLFIPSRLYGDLRVGQEIIIKYSSFPFRKYGIYHGTIKELPKIITHPLDNNSLISISEPFYRAKIDIKEQNIRYQKKVFNLTSGLTFNADIVFAREPLIEAIISPLFEFLEK